MVDSRSVFTGGLELPEKRIAYRSSLYWVLFFFVLLDSSMVIFASSKGVNLLMFTTIMLITSVVMLRAL